MWKIRYYSCFKIFGFGDLNLNGKGEEGKNVNNMVGLLCLKSFKLIIQTNY
jgi:hypothetical protein